MEQQKTSEAPAINQASTDNGGLVEGRGEWISTNERKPEQGQCVDFLVRGKTWDQGNSWWQGAYIKGLFYAGALSWSAPEVTHWQPTERHSTLSTNTTDSRHD